MPVCRLWQVRTSNTVNEIMLKKNQAKFVRWRWPESARQTRITRLLVGRNDRATEVLLKLWIVDVPSAEVLLFVMHDLLIKHYSKNTTGLSGAARFSPVIEHLGLTFSKIFHINLLYLSTLADLATCFAYLYSGNTSMQTASIQTCI